MCFGFAVWPVGAADGLQQRMVAHRLVKVHRLENRRVETRQQLRGHDQYLQGVRWVAEAVEQFLLLVTIPVEGGVFGLPAVNRHHDVRHFRLQILVECLFIEHAAFSVESDHLRSETARCHLLLEVAGDVRADFLDALR